MQHEAFVEPFFGRGVGMNISQPATVRKKDTKKASAADKWGKKARPGTFREVTAGQREYPKSTSVEKRKLCSDPISADPSCPFPNPLLLLLRLLLFTLCILLLLLSLSLLSSLLSLHDYSKAAYIHAIIPGMLHTAPQS